MYMTSKLNHPSPTPEDQAQWPETVLLLCHDLKACRSHQARRVIIGRLWLLLNGAILINLRILGRSFSYGQEDDYLDIASEKSLDLLQKFDLGKWDPTSDSPARLFRFVTVVARNGLIDHLRVVGKKAAESVDHEELGLAGHVSVPTIDSKRFAQALADCAASLQPRARVVWFLRVLLEMPSKAIAVHPAVQMTVGNVDVTLARCRDHFSRCMAEKGREPKHIPRGVFVELWDIFKGDLTGLKEDPPTRGKDR